MNGTKPSNPKDVFGSAKLDLGLAPDTMEIMAAEAFLEGALKYGRYNWRIAGVRASIYYAALKRHMKKWWNGQNRDPKTRVHHLCNAMACIVIMFDAELYGKLEDDRPPSPDPDAMANLIDSMEKQVAHLKSLFKDHKPHQFTIADTRVDRIAEDTEAEFLSGSVDPDLNATPAQAELDALLDAQLNGPDTGAFRVVL